MSSFVVSSAIGSIQKNENRIVNRIEKTLAFLKKRLELQSTETQFLNGCLESSKKLLLLIQQRIKFASVQNLNRASIFSLFNGNPLRYLGR